MKSIGLNYSIKGDPKLILYCDKYATEGDYHEDFQFIQLLTMNSNYIFRRDVFTEFVYAKENMGILAG
jgi:hypothetical protein